VKAGEGREVPMAMPKPRTKVPRSKVGTFVGLMLAESEVADVECREDAGGTYTVTPLPRGAGGRGTDDTEE
jgi:hypothetical protein